MRRDLVGVRGHPQGQVVLYGHRDHLHMFGVHRCKFVVYCLEECKGAFLDNMLGLQLFEAKNYLQFYGWSTKARFRRGSVGPPLADNLPLVST